MKQKINGHNVHRETHRRGQCIRYRVERDENGENPKIISLCHLDLPENQPAVRVEKTFDLGNKGRQHRNRKARNRIKDKMQKESRRKNRAPK